MKILIVSATAKENGFIKGLKIENGVPSRLLEPFNHEVDALVTGIGAVQTTFFLTRVIDQYHLVINIGVAGSFKPNYPIGSVVCIKEDSFGDYGIDDRGVFKSLSELKPENDLHFHGDILINPWLGSDFFGIKTPLVKGVTVATASGSLEKISKIEDRWNADIETMESASVFYVCSIVGVKFICFRAISNMVEPRDRSKWDLDLAINNLTSEVSDFISSL